MADPGPRGDAVMLALWVRVVGHGVEGDGAVYCCAHCARRQSMQAVADRA